MSIPHDQIDADALKVVHRLTRNGFDAYLVGGCVRDLLLARKPKDFDVATSATPTEIKALFRNCRIIGRRFRLAHVFFGPKIIETSTFRANPREVEIADGDGAAEVDPHEGSPREEPELLIRRDNVFGSAEEDARRRDFTINGLFYDVDADRVIDYVDGMADLERRTVRTIGDAEIRFREDPVRMLRAIKFAARLDFTIETAAYHAILQHKGEIAKCAAPRVVEEVYRLMRGGAARRSFELLEDTGVLEVLMAPLAEWMKGSAADRNRLYHTLESLDAYVRAGEAPTNALLLAVLLAPFLDDLLYDVEDAPREARGDVSLILWERAQPAIEAMRASRRDTEYARQMLLVQRRIAPSANKRRRGRPMALVRRDWFPEALALFAMLHPQPEPEVVEEVARWHRLMRAPQHEPRAAEAGEAGDAEPTAHERPGDPAAAHSEQPDGEGRAKRRRRRRGGRRRRKNGTAPIATQPLPEASAEPSTSDESKPPPVEEYDIWKD